MIKAPDCQRLGKSLEQKNRFLLLDGARGIAALSILFYHANVNALRSFQHPFGPEFLQHCFLSVDLFFMMSGLVVARAYEEKLRSGAMAFTHFYTIRLIRLWPLYIAGTCMGLAYVCLKAWAEPSAQLLTSNPFQAFAMGLLFIPDFIQQHTLFPLDGPAWSLSLELVVNVAYALLATRLSTRMLVVGTLLAGAALFWHSQMGTQLNVGWLYKDAFGGMLRVLFAFPLGVLLYRWVRGMKTQLPPILAPLLLAGLALMLLTPFSVPGALYDLVCLYLIIPAFVMLTCITRVPHICASVFAWLGAVSYALYILHEPLLYWCVALFKLITKTPIDTYANMAAPFLILAVVLICAVACRLDDRLRRWLTVHYVTKR